MKHTILSPEFYVKDFFTPEDTKERQALEQVESGLDGCYFCVHMNMCYSFGWRLCYAGQEIEEAQYER